jgi:hypothetical protein
VQSEKYYETDLCEEIINLDQSVPTGSAEIDEECIIQEALGAIQDVEPQSEDPDYGEARDLN